MEPCSQRESEALRRAFRISLNDTGNTQHTSDETHLASVAQVGRAFTGFTTLILGQHFVCDFGMHIATDTHHVET